MVDDAVQKRTESSRTFGVDAPQRTAIVSSPRNVNRMLDLYDAEFVLLQLGNEAVDAEAISQAAVRAGLPLRVERIDDPSIAALYERALVLVRPDGYVAWRGDALPEDPKALIDRGR